LTRRKKILGIVVKTLVGVGSFLVIYLRLKSDFTPEKSALLLAYASSPEGLSLFTAALFLIPVNWGIEAYKWKLITKPIEPVTYRTATKSVYAGVCLGNLAPGRATEFLAKIIYFHIENRPRITVLHFVGGLFQLSVTIFIGFIAISAKLKEFGPGYSWIVNVVTAVGIALLIGLALAVWKIEAIMEFISKRINRENAMEEFEYRFTPKLLAQLFSLSMLRYGVFFLQFALILLVFRVDAFMPSVLAGIAVYFLITTTIPMISVLEAAIRAAVALIVFQGTGISNSILALSSVMVWIVNIIIPSVAGYYFLVRKKFNFRLFGRRK
jgi:hypothetical protein